MNEVKAEKQKNCQDTVSDWIRMGKRRNNSKRLSFLLGQSPSCVTWGKLLVSASLDLPISGAQDDEFGD